MATGGVSDLDRGTDETFDILCSMCQENNKNTEGEHFCADCSDYYCSACLKVHDVVPALRNHKIVDKKHFKLSLSVQFPAVPTERCRVHGHKPVDMFCQQHDTVGCAICMVVQHSDCKEKFYVPDYIKNITTAINPNKITVHMDVIVNSLADLQKEFIKEKEYVRSSKEKSLKRIQNWRNEINGLLDKLENKTVQALEQRFQSLTDKIETALRELQATTNDIQSAQDSFKSAGGNMAQMFVSIKMANEVASLAQEKVNSTQSQVSSTEISFLPHQNLQSILKEMQALGDISIRENLQSKSTAPVSLQQVTKDLTSLKSSKTPSTTASLQLGTVAETSLTSLSSQSKTATLLPVTMTKTSHTSSKTPSTTSSLQLGTVAETSLTSLSSQSKTATLLPGTMTQTSRTSSKTQLTTSALQSGTVTETSHTSLSSQSKTATLLPVTMTQTRHTSSKTQSTTSSLQSGTVTETSLTSLSSQSKTATLLPVTMTQTSHTSSKTPSTTASLQSGIVTETSHTSLSSQSKTATLLPVTMTQTSQQSYESKSKHSLLQVKGKKTYSVKVKSDRETCNISSSCTLADGIIILSDFKNSKLKRVNNTSLKFNDTDYCEVPGYPNQVCAITDKEVAVACDYSKLIQFVSIGRTMQQNRQIKTGFPCYALAYADKELFVSDWTSVYVYSMLYSMSRLEKFHLAHSVQRIFSDIRSLVVSSDHSVADWNKGLVILNRTGQLIGQYNGPELKGAFGVWLYKNDNVLVCGYISQNVLLFSHDGKLLGEIMKTDGKCQAVCCNNDNTKLIISQFLEDEIEVYDIV